MGYRLDEVIVELERVAPDVILLQEVDMFDDGRSYSVHGVQEIAKALGLNAVFMQWVDQIVPSSLH